MKILLIPLILLVFIGYVQAHGDDLDDTNSLRENMSEAVLNTMYISIIIILISTLISIFYEKKVKKYKRILFLSIAIPAIITTLVLSISTIYLNSISDTKGPVHWHADFEIWNCGKKVEIKDPEGFSNRVGSAVFHEHNDNRIHVEGVLIDTEEASLDNFFHTIGGDLHDEGFKVPTEKGFTTVKNNDLCNGKPSALQVFVYKTKGNRYYQEKLDHFDEYVLSPYSEVPPGDCIIIEFDSGIKEKTNHICNTYKIAIEKGDIYGS